MSSSISIPRKVKAPVDATINAIAGNVVIQTNSTNRATLLSDGGLQLGNSHGAANSGSNTSKLRHNTTSQRLEVSMNGVAYSTIVSADAVGNTSNIPFWSSGNLSQATAAQFYFQYDPSSYGRVRIGTNVDHAAKLTVQSYFGIGDNIFRGLYYGGAMAFSMSQDGDHASFEVWSRSPNLTKVKLAANAASYINTTSNFGLGTDTPQTKLDVNGAVQFAGTGAAVSSLGTARLRYNTGTGDVEISKNGGAYASMPAPVTFVDQETPTRTTDRTNKYYYLAFTPTSGSELIVYNGAVQEGRSTSETTTTATMTFTNGSATVNVSSETEFTVGDILRSNNNDAVGVISTKNGDGTLTLQGLWLGATIGPATGKIITANDDYVIIGKTFAFALAPGAGHKIRVWYRK